MLTLTPLTRYSQGRQPHLEALTLDGPVILPLNLGQDTRDPGLYVSPQLTQLRPRQEGLECVFPSTARLSLFNRMGARTGAQVPT